jgi:arsenate reductase
MAEGLLQKIAGDQLIVLSAGSAPSHVNPLAIRVMRERGIDISHHRSKHVGEFAGQPFDVVITVCDQAAETCPLFPGKAERIHWSFPDPAKAEGNEQKRLAVFRTVRDALSERLGAWWQEQQTKESEA